MSNPPTTRVRWLLVFWLFVLSAVAFLDRVNISVAGSSLASAYGFSHLQLGWVFSSFLAGYALFQTIGGRLADRMGPRRTLTVGVLWWGIFTALTAAVPSGIGGALILFIAVRFCLGAGEAVVFPASNQFVARWIPTVERGRANGWIFAGVGVGAGLSPPLITYLMVHYSWRFSFWICAVIGLLTGTVWYVIAHDDPEHHPRVSTAELAFIRSGAPLAVGTAESRGVGSKLVPWRSVLKSVDVLAVTLSYFCFGYVGWIFFSWFYIYLAQVRGLNLKASAFYAMLPFIAMAVGCPLGGIISDRLTRWYGARSGRCVLAAVVMAAAAGFLSFGSFVESPRMASVLLASGAGALYLAQSSFWTVTADIAGTSCGFVSGFMNMGAQVGGAVTASLTPWIADRFGWMASFVVSAALCLLGALSWLVVDPARTLSLTCDLEIRTSPNAAAYQSRVTPAGS